MFVNRRPLKAAVSVPQQNIAFVVSIPQEEAVPVAMVLHRAPLGEGGRGTGGHTLAPPPGIIHAAAAPRPMRGVCDPQQNQDPFTICPQECTLVADAVMSPAPKGVALVFQHMLRGCRLNSDCMVVAYAPRPTFVVSQYPPARKAASPHAHTVPLASTASAPKPFVACAAAPPSYVLSATLCTPSKPCDQPTVVTSVGVLVLLV